MRFKLSTILVSVFLTGLLIYGFVSLISNDPYSDYAPGTELSIANSNGTADTVTPGNWPYPTVWNWNYSGIANVNGGTVGACYYADKYWLNRWNSANVYLFANTGTNGGPGGTPTTITYAGNIRDMTVAPDGSTNDFIWGSAATTTLYKFSSTGSTLGTYTIPQQMRAIVWDPNRKGFWCCNWTTDIKCYDTTGALKDTYAGGLSLASKYGLAWDSGHAHQDTATLFVWHQTPGQTLTEVDLGSKTTIRSFLIAAGTNIAGGAEAYKAHNSNDYWLVLNYQNYANVAYKIGTGSTPTQQPRNVLLEFCTGTWCGWCPCGHQAAHQIDSVYPGTVILGYHGGGSDPFQNFNGNSVRTLLGYQGYPTGIIDRQNHPGNGSTYPYVTYTMWMGRVQTRYTSSPIADVGIHVQSVTYYPPTRQLKVILDMTAQQNLNGTYKLQYVLTENGLVYNQSSYSQCPPGGPNYVHNEVVRDMVNGATGETVSTGAWNQNTTYTDTLTTTLNSSWVWSNCYINMFVYRDSTSQLFHSTIAQARDTSLSAITGIKNPNLKPDEYTLLQNYPNPFNPITNVHFSIPKSERVTFKIYDVQGKEVAVYLDDFLNAGQYNVEIDGSGLSSGVYFYRLVAGDFVSTKKMILTK